MSLATRCPQCQTVFRVVQDQLRVSEGWVRCGRCAEVFNASKHLVDAFTGETRRSPIEVRSGLPARDPASPTGPGASTLERAAAARERDAGEGQPRREGREGPEGPGGREGRGGPDRREGSAGRAGRGGRGAHDRDRRHGGTPATGRERSGMGAVPSAPGALGPADSRASALDTGAHDIGAVVEDSWGGAAFEPSADIPLDFADLAERGSGHDAGSVAEHAADLAAGLGLDGHSGSAMPPGPLGAGAAGAGAAAARSGSEDAEDADQADAGDDAEAADGADEGVEAGDPTASRDAAERGGAATSAASAASGAAATAAIRRRRRHKKRPPAAASMPGELPSFVRRAQRAARWRHPAVRAALGIGAIAAGALLAAQWLHAYRDEAAARWPALQPLLAQACETLGCTLEPVRSIDAVVVESSGLIKAERAETYHLSIALRNQRSFEVALPAVDLVLTDTQGRLIARRVLRGGELGAPAATLRASGDLALHATIEVAAVPVAGYTIELFYP